MNYKKPELKLISWDIVGLWSFNVQIETCAICRNHVMDSCVDCQNGIEFNNECTISWGKCGHAFHKHCITKWASMKNVCPLDTEVWVEDEQRTA